MGEVMPLKPNAPRTGHLDEESKNVEKKTGRDDGFGPGPQGGTGHKQEGGDLVTGSNPDKRAQLFRQSPSNRGEDLAAQEAMAEVTRADSVHAIGETE
jgi:hypothetical protein